MSIEEITKILFDSYLDTEPGIDELLYGVQHDMPMMIDESDAKVVLNVIAEQQIEIQKLKEEVRRNGTSKQNSGF